PVLEISVRVDLGATQTESRRADDLGIMVLAAVDLNEPAIEEGRSLGLEKDEAQPVGAGMKLARIVEAEIDAAQPRTLQPGDRGALEFGVIDGGQAGFERGGEEGVVI